MGNARNLAGLLESDGDLKTERLDLSGEIGVNVQGYSAATVLDPEYVHTDHNLTDTFKAILETRQVHNVVGDPANNRLIITYTDGVVSYLNIDALLTDVSVEGASLDVTTNVLTLNGADGVNVVVNLSDFVNSLELANALALKQDTLVSASNIRTMDGESLLGSGDLDYVTHSVVHSAQMLIRTQNVMASMVIKSNGYAT